MMALKLAAQSIGDYIQVSSQNPIIVLGYAKVLATNDTQITVQSKSDTYTFNRKDISIRPGTKPTTQFVAATPTPTVIEVADIAPTRRMPVMHSVITTNYNQTIWLDPNYPSNRPHQYPANFVPNTPQPYKPNYNSKNLHVGEIIHIQALGLNIPNAQVVSASPTSLIVKEPGEKSDMAYDSQSLGVLNVTPQSSPPSPVPALPKSAPTKPNSAPSPNGLSISRHESGF
jgi:hypothetical protein